MFQGPINFFETSFNNYSYGFSKFRVLIRDKNLILFILYPLNFFKNILFTFKLK